MLIRLSKCIADSGLCSRRQANRLIAAGDVTVAGIVASGNGWVEVDEYTSITVAGTALAPVAEKHYLMYNKPIGIDCNYSSRADSLLKQINFSTRLFPIGRLDKDSHGLLLLTNDGEFCQQLMHPRYHHPKTYRVRVDKKLHGDFVIRMSQGIEILDRVTQACQVTLINAVEFEIILTQGLNRQIRRMCKTLGYQVVDLKRIQILNIKLGNLAMGSWRLLQNIELKTLETLQQNSTQVKTTK